MRLEIIGTGSYVPDEVVENDFFERKDFWHYDSAGNSVGEARRLKSEEVFNLIGIRERRKSKEDENPSDMGYCAAVNAVEKAGISASSLVGIIVASVSQTSNFPNAAQRIQKKLDAKRVRVAYDIQNACAGFPEALAQANARVLRLMGNYLVVASECLTKITDYTDINSTLFGDGAGAAVLMPTDSNRGIVAEYTENNPFEGNDILIFRDDKGFLRMPYGEPVMKRAIKSMIESARCLKKDAGWNRADVYVPHQANLRIIEGVEKRIASEGAVVYRNIERYGNMSAATCAVALDEALRDGTIKKGDKVIITSFGAGLVTSGVAAQF